MRQVGFLNVGGYVRRDYAPLADRLRSAIEALRQVPDFLEELDASLEGEVGRPVLEMSIESYSGMARFYRVDLGQAVADFSDKAVLEPFNQARGSGGAGGGTVRGPAAVQAGTGQGRLCHWRQTVRRHAGQRGRGNRQPIRIGDAGTGEFGCQPGTAGGSGGGGQARPKHQRNGGGYRSPAPLRRGPDTGNSGYAGIHPAEPGRPGPDLRPLRGPMPGDGNAHLHALRLRRHG